jgi:hypothetical protein
VTTVALVSYVVSALAAFLMYTVLSANRTLALFEPRYAFYLLWVIGLAMSGLAGTRDMVDGKFTLPNVINYPLIALGIAAFVLLVVTAFHIRVPFITGYRDAFVALSVLIAAKWGMVHLYLASRAVVQTISAIYK